MNPFLGRNFEAMDPLDWLARLADHIPDAGKHRTHFYAYYANRVRGQRPAEEVEGPAAEDEAPKKRRCSPSWARLISKVYQADPLVCRQCGGPLKVVAYVTDELSIGESSTISASVRSGWRSRRLPRRSSASPSTVRVGAYRQNGSELHISPPGRPPQQERIARPQLVAPWGQVTANSTNHSSEG